MEMKQFLLVFIGGGVGSMLRFGISKMLNTAVFPYGTWTVNILGSLIIGMVMGFFIKESSPNHNLVFLLATGFCGGFTTFSAFSLENFDYLRAGNYANFMLYTLSSIVLAFLAVFIGTVCSKQF